MTYIHPNSLEGFPGGYGSDQAEADRILRKAREDLDALERRQRARREASPKPIGDPFAPLRGLPPVPLETLRQRLSGHGLTADDIQGIAKAVADEIERRAAEKADAA